MSTEVKWNGQIGYVGDVGIYAVGHYDGIYRVAVLTVTNPHWIVQKFGTLEEGKKAAEAYHRAQQDELDLRSFSQVSLTAKQKIQRAHKSVKQHLFDTAEELIEEAEKDPRHYDEATEYEIGQMLKEQIW